MGNIRIDLANILTISLVGFLGVWVINRGLKKAGLTQYAAV
jgi:hypothetical protein